jgi:hypothetical protein
VKTDAGNGNTACETFEIQGAKEVKKLKVCSGPTDQGNESNETNYVK